MDSHDILARHGEHAEGVVPAQVVLGREREPGQIGEVAQVVGLDANPVERRPVVRDIVVRPAKGRFQPG